MNDKPSFTTPAPGTREEEKFLNRYWREALSLYTPDQLDHMIDNMRLGFEGDHVPVCHIYLPDHPVHYLLASARSGGVLDYEFWGLADLGLGQVKLGSFLLSDKRIAFYKETGKILQPDENFNAGGRRLSDFLQAARKAGHLVL